MRRSIMHASHVGTSYMRQTLRKDGFDTSLPMVPAILVELDEVDAKSVITLAVNRANPAQIVFLQAA